jgi:hypothetical protein
VGCLRWEENTASKLAGFTRRPIKVLSGATFILGPKARTLTHLAETTGGQGEGEKTVNVVRLEIYYGITLS